MLKKYTVTKILINTIQHINNIKITLNIRFYYWHFCTQTSESPLEELSSFCGPLQIQHCFQDYEALHWVHPDWKYKKNVDMHIRMMSTWRSILETLTYNKKTQTYPFFLQLLFHYLLLLLVQSLIPILVKFGESGWDLMVSMTHSDMWDA